MAEFTYYLPDKRIPDSEEFSAETPICCYFDDDGCSVSIIVNGEPTWNDDEEELEDNNWYEIIFYDQEGNEICSDCASIEGMTPQELKQYCAAELADTY